MSDALSAASWVSSEARWLAFEATSRVSLESLEAFLDASSEYSEALLEASLEKSEALLEASSEESEALFRASRKYSEVLFCASREYSEALSEVFFAAARVRSSASRASRSACVRVLVACSL